MAQKDRFVTPRQGLLPKGRNAAFPQLSLCLSRACLGKMIVFSIKWHTKEGDQVVSHRASVRLISVRHDQTDPITPNTRQSISHGRIGPIPSAAVAVLSSAASSLRPVGRSVATCAKRRALYFKRVLLRSSRACLGNRPLCFLTMKLGKEAEGQALLSAPEAL